MLLRRMNMSGRDMSALSRRDGTHLDQGAQFATVVCLFLTNGPDEQITGQQFTITNLRGMLAVCTRKCLQGYHSAILKPLNEQGKQCSFQAQKAIMGVHSQEPAFSCFLLFFLPVSQLRVFVCCAVCERYITLPLGQALLWNFASVLLRFVLLISSCLYVCRVSCCKL